MTTDDSRQDERQESHGVGGGRSEKAELLLKYLEIATTFRNHEFQIQMLRNAAFAAVQGVLLTLFAVLVTRQEVFLLPLMVALLGLAISFLWRSYFEGSQFWAWYWESRTRAINDEFRLQAGLDVDLFQDHSSRSDTVPGPILHAGRWIPYKPAQMRLVQIPLVFAALWLVLAGTAGYRAWRAFTNPEPPSSSRAEQESARGGRELTPRVETVTEHDLILRPATPSE